MKSQQFSSFLTAFSHLEAHSGCRERAQDLVALAHLFSAAGARSVGDTLEKCRQSVSEAGGRPIAPSHLVERVEVMRLVLVAGGAAKAAEACDALREFLSRVQDDKLRQLNLDGAMEIIASPPAKKKTAKQMDVALRRGFADRLTSAIADKAIFKSIVSELSDIMKSATLEDLTDIAQRFLGNDRSFKTKAETFKAIELRRKQVEAQDNRHRALTKIAV